MSAARLWLARWLPWFTELPCTHPAVGGHQVAMYGDALAIYAECERCGR